MLQLDAIYTTEELAEILKRKPRTLEDWRRDGKGPDYARLPKGVRYLGRDVQVWLDAQVVKVSR